MPGPHYGARMIDWTEDQALFISEGETVTFRPYGGTPRSISAIIDRNPPSAFGEMGNTPVMIVTVANSDTIGISSSELNTGRDQIDIAERYGATATTRTVVSIVRHDAGMLTVEVR